MDLCARVVFLVFASSFYSPIICISNNNPTNMNFIFAVAFPQRIDVTQIGKKSYINTTHSESVCCFSLSCTFFFLFFVTFLL